MKGFLLLLYIAAVAVSAALVSDGRCGAEGGGGSGTDQPPAAAIR